MRLENLAGKSVRFFSARLDAGHSRGLLDDCASKRANHKQCRNAS
jgi:hypothetical protein